MKEKAMLGVAIALSVLYGGLCLAAFRHVRPETKREQVRLILALSPWWPLYNELYDETAQARSFRRVGVLILIATVVSYLLAFCGGN